MADPDASCYNKLICDAGRTTDVVELDSYVEELLNKDEVQSEKHISLYDVFSLTRQFHCEYRAYEKDMRNVLNEKLKKINENFCAILCDMDYSTCIAHLIVVKKKKSICEYEDIFFSKDEMGLYIEEVKGKKILDDQTLAIIGTDLLQLYDYQLMCKDKRFQGCCSVKTLNSEFYANISCSYVEIYLEYDGRKRFDINLYSDTDKVKCKCTSRKLMQLLKREYKQFYSHIFVQIEECPQWMQCSLFEIRKEQLILEEKKRKRSKRHDALKHLLKVGK